MQEVVHNIFCRINPSPRTRCQETQIQRQSVGKAPEGVDPLFRRNPALHKIGRGFLLCEWMQWQSVQRMVIVVGEPLFWASDGGALKRIAASDNEYDIGMDL